MNTPTLSVIIPAHNEALTIAALLDAVAEAPFSKQIIVVDDGSNDGTGAIAEAWGRHAVERRDLVVSRHATNRGKGAAIRTGLNLAKGMIALIQDADLEYDPSDYPALVQPILDGLADAAFGSRYLTPRNCHPWTPNRICVHLLNALVYILYGGKLSDEATCYKVFRTKDLRRMDLRCKRFEFCPEVTAKALLMGLTIREVPIRYRPRSRREGKKIRWWDGIEAMATLIRWRLVRFHPREVTSKNSARVMVGGRP
jgi:glycosyltransferase involved in cell wall biosynthesis